MLRVRSKAEWARWYLNRTISRIVPMRWRRVGKLAPLSMILLLRHPHTFSDEDFRRAAERAWGLSFSSVEGSTRRVVKSDDAVFLQAGPHRLSFVNHPKPYEEKPEEDLDWLPKLEQQRAWAEHTACLWVYYLTAGTDLQLAHSILAKVLEQLLDEDCAGVYVPSESSLIPAEEASVGLQEIAAHSFSGLVPES
jgi:hypothetical protein